VVHIYTHTFSHEKQKNSHLTPKATITDVLSGQYSQSCILVLMIQIEFETIHNTDIFVLSLISHELHDAEALEKTNYEQFFTLDEKHYSLRGHDKKLVKKRSRLDTRKFFFSQRVVNSWNRLPAEVVNAASVNGFKNAYDRWCYKDMDDRS